MDTVTQIEAQLIMRHYDGFTPRSGRIQRPSLVSLELDVRAVGNFATRPGVTVRVKKIGRGGHREWPKNPRVPLNP